MKIGEMIKERRNELGLTQEEVAIEVGVSKPTVSRWESGNIKSLKEMRIKKLARVLQMDEQYFFQREEILLPEELDVVRAYREAKAGTRESVRKLLDILKEE